MVKVEGGWAKWFIGIVWRDFNLEMERRLISYWSVIFLKRRLRHCPIFMRFAKYFRIFVEFDDIFEKFENLSKFEHMSPGKSNRSGFIIIKDKKSSEFINENERKTVNKLCKQLQNKYKNKPKTMFHCLLLQIPFKFFFSPFQFLSFNFRSIVVIKSY